MSEDLTEIHISTSGDTVAVGDEFEVINSVKTSLIDAQLSVGDVLEVTDIRTDMPNGAEVMVDSDVFRVERAMSPTTIGEALGVAEYMNDPEPCLKQL